MVKGRFCGFFGKLTKCSLAIRPVALLSFYPFLRKANFLDKVGGISRPSPVKSLQLVDT